jgi:hypothetical protein
VAFFRQHFALKLRTPHDSRALAACAIFEIKRRSQTSPPGQICAGLQNNANFWIIVLLQLIR